MTNPISFIGSAPTPDGRMRYGAVWVQPCSSQLPLSRLRLQTACRSKVGRQSSTATPSSFAASGFACGGSTRLRAGRRASAVARRTAAARQRRTPSTGASAVAPSAASSAIATATDALSSSAACPVETSERGWCDGAMRSGTQPTPACPISPRRLKLDWPDAAFGRDDSTGRGSGGGHHATRMWR